MRMFAVLILVTLCAVMAVPKAFSQADDNKAEKASHKETGTVAASEKTKCGRLTTFVLSSKGNLLCCDATTQSIKVITPEDKLVGTLKLGFQGQAITTAGEFVYVAGRGVIVKLDANGKVVKKITASGNKALPDAKASGLAVSDKDVFAAFGTGGSLRSRSVLLRMTTDLADPVQIAKGLRGCCQRLDLSWRDDVLYVAENAAHRVVKLDREGKVLSKWGSRDRTNLAGFGSCCNPMNLRFAPNGDLYTAESGLGRIKRYSADGKFLGLVGYVGTNRFTRASGLAASCSNIALDISKDAGRIYVLDYKNSLIRVLSPVKDDKKE
jgi:DNA-binding beta-propeller fold protein YncE